MVEVVPATNENLRRAAEMLRSGELVSFPTETVYGLGANAADPDAVRRIFEAKGRPASHPLIVHLPDGGLLKEWAVDVPPVVDELARRFWPGPLTLVLRRAPGVPLEVTGGQETVAVRVPGHPVARRLLREFGGGVAAPSANRFGRISPTRAEHVVSELGDSVGLVLDGGPSEVGLESTILDLSEGVPQLLRPGGVSREALAEVLGTAPASPRQGDGPRAPGRLASHYAPSSPVRLVAGADLAQAAESSAPATVLALSAPPAGFDGRWLRMPANAEGYARDLYGALRELDLHGLPILVEAPPTSPPWEAVNDRLARAAAGAHRTGNGPETGSGADTESEPKASSGPETNTGPQTERSAETERGG
jgi:L-threonylcarbamoyladenylate synthase